MDAPLNEKIDRTLKRKAARKKNDSNFMPVLSLHEQVLSLVKEANSKIPQERHVTPRSALIVMNRALASLSSLDSESRDFAVLKDVSRFLNVATKTFTASQTDNTDLLVAGHPLSTLNASIPAEEFLKKNAQWIAADPSIDESIRPLVASAHSATPGSLERQHAFARLSANKIILASYFKIDNLSPIVAAFGDGNSSSARRARVALQWRDRKGRWVEMGRGANFNFRMPDGSVAKASGVYVGVRPKRPGENYTAGLIQVSGNKNLPGGIYAVRAGDVETYAARITPAQLEKAGVSSKARVDQNRINVPSRDELVAARLDAPAGWTKNSDNTFNSDDNYTVKGGDGEYTLYRQNEDGSLGDKVGEGANWADINDLANEDQVAYDAIKGQDSSAQQEQIKARLDIRTAHNAEFDRLEELVDSGVDQNGNKVPAGWEGIVRPGRAAEIERRAIGADRVLGEEGLPSVEYKKAIAYDYDTDPVYAEAGYDLTGKFSAYDKRYDSWEEAEADIPRWIKAEEDRRGRKLTPLESEEIKIPTLDDSPSDIVNPFKPAPARDDRAGFFDRDGNRLPGEPAGDDPLPALTDEQNKKIDAEIRDLIKNPPAPTEMDKRVEQLLKEQREEYDKAIAADNARVFDKDELDAEEIYNRRMAGESLDKVAKDLGLTREEVRRLEAEYGRTLDKNPTPDEPSPLWGAKNSIEKPDGKTFDIILAEMDEPYDDDKTLMQSVVDQANDLGIHVDLSPEQTGLGFGDERVVRFTFPEKTVSKELAKKLIGSDPDSGDGILLSRIENQEDWDDALAEIAGENTSEDKEDGLWGSVNSIEKPDGKTFDIILAEMDELWDNDKTLMQHVVDESNGLGIYVELSPEQTGLGFGDERVARFIFPERTVSKELAKKLIGEGPDSNEDGILMSRISTQEDWDEAIQDITDSRTDEPPSPPSGGTPPKTPSPNVPSAPGLFNGFNVPDGAFKFNTVSYEPEGRVDEASKDFTDDPKKLATKFTPQELVQALSQAMLGNSTDAALAEILNANVDDDNDIVDPADIQDSVNIPQVNLGSPSGAGQLEFSAGAEFVPAEALFNAIWEAGLDPNRVVANIYDSVNGNNDNLNKLIDAQGGVPSAEEAQLVDDIVQEIRQLKDASEPGDSPVANEKQTPSPDPLPGSLIENIPIDFNNPDYYIPNPESYIPSQPEVDENGYTDNPEILSRDYWPADLIEQMLSGITDGSGAALLAFDNITVEVPIEAMRDAIQYQDINTNQILLDLKKESNDMGDTTPRLQAHSQMIQDLVEQTGNTVDDDTADKIRDAIDEKGLLDWSEADDAEIIEAITEVAGSGILEPAPTPAAERRLPPTTGQRKAAETPEVPIDSPEAETPQFNYPGPRENGYSANNTILDSNRVAVGAGSRIQALSDGRAGTIVAVQNIDTKTGRDADYARIRFDDGTTAVRSARQIFGIDAGAPVAQGEGPGQLPPARRNPVPQDPAVRLNEPAPQGIPVIAGNGDIPGVMLADTPQDLVEFTNPDARQSDYAAWGLRAPEIARAGRDRATIKNIEDLVVKTEEARTAARNASTADERDKADAEVSLYYTQLKKLVRDTFGIRAGVALGSSNYTIKEEANVSFSMYNSGEVSVGISFRILDSNGTDIGQGSRSLRRANVEQPDGTTVQEWSVSNDILVIEDNSKKQSGFAAAYNRYMEDWYIANGFKKIKVHAAAGARWQGGLVWALNGFIWDGPSQAGRVPAILRKMLNDARTTEEEKKIIKDMQGRIAELNPTGNYSPGTVPTPLEIALIGSSQGASKGSSWAGKRAMSSLDWYGVKNLDPAAIEQRQAVNYDQMRNARKRIAGNVNRPNVSRELVLKTNSNEFADANPELAPYIDYIRDVLRSNRSLAVLSPGAKTALNRFTASQLMKGEDRTLSLEDIIKLRIALDAEFKADNPLSASSDFGVGNQLLDVSMDDVRKNNVPGFTIKELGVYESGVNDTYMVTHNDSGQIFFLKKDAYASMYSINGPGAEVQADTMLRASGVVAGYETRVSNVDPEVLVMQRAGVGVPLLGEPMTASNALYKMSIDLPDGTTVKVNPQNFMDLLHTPEDAIRVMLVDLIISNVDRHNGNLLIAIDGTDTGKIRILPIDHALSSFSPDVERIQDTVLQVFNEGNDNLYGMAMPVLTKRLRQQELLALFRNEARTMMEGLNNPANLPTGKELDLIISNFGSLDAYRQKIQERIDSLLNPNGEGYKTLLNVLKPSYWSQR